MKNIILFLIWVFGMIPLASMIHLGIWYGAALIVVRWHGAEEWLNGGRRWGMRLVRGRTLLGRDEM